MTRICLGTKLKDSRTVTSLPLRYCWEDYSTREKKLILGAEKIYFPTIHYAPAFFAIGKEIFPTLQSYLLLGNKIAQLQAFRAANIPVPRTRIFPGRNRMEKIIDAFSFPFVAKIPVGASRGLGVFLIENEQDLRTYLNKVSVAYIQEYIHTDRDIRVVIIGNEPVLSYWKIGRGGTFKTNVAQGGEIDFDRVPEAAVELALLAAKRCSLDHAGFDVCMGPSGPVIFEANIHFGREGFKEAGVSYHHLLAKMADSARI